MGFVEYNLIIKMYAKVTRYKSSRLMELIMNPSANVRFPFVRVHHLDLFQLDFDWGITNKLRLDGIGRKGTPMFLYMCVTDRVS